MIEETLVAFLADLAPVYPGFLPERAGHPALTLRLISSTRIENHDGDSGLVTARYQVTGHASTHPEALALVRAVRGRFVAANGPLGSYDLTNNVTVENETDLGFTSDSESWNYSLDVIVNFKEE